MSPHRLKIGISCGDVTGIGPEVVVGALYEELALEDIEWIVYGDPQILRSLPKFAIIEDTLKDRLTIIAPHKDLLSLDLPPGAPEASEAALIWINEASQACLKGEIDAMVTAPVNKHSITKLGVDFTGHTEWIAKIAASQQVTMMLLGSDEKGRWLRVALVTTHVALKKVPEQINPEKVYTTCMHTIEACRLLNLQRIRVAVAGLNPHAGEHGEFGDEEQNIIKPVIEQLKTQGYLIEGPISADSLFYHAIQGAYDAVVAMYHDQGLAPLKLVAFDRGVNWTLGLPFIRTSPDHGTAYSIARKGIAKSDSMLQAIRLAICLARRRRQTNYWPW